VKVRSSLLKVDGLTGLTLQLEPPTAHFRFDKDKLSMQDLVKAVRAAGSEYDARLIVQSSAPADTLGPALRSVKGVRSPGFPDKHGIWLITFFLDQTTSFSDLEAAASTVGAKLADSGLKT
jgi:hypothetical protein